VILIGPGDAHPCVGMVKRRLGVYPADDEFTDQLAGYVRGAQMRLGLPVDGLIDDRLIDHLHLLKESHPRQSRRISDADEAV
jgi:hypothetical protein